LGKPHHRRFSRAENEDLVPLTDQLRYQSFRQAAANRVLPIPERKASQIDLESHSPLDRPCLTVRAGERSSAGRQHCLVQRHRAHTITYWFGLEPFREAVEVGDVCAEPHDLKLLTCASPVLHESCKNELDHRAAGCVRDLLELIHDHTAYRGENTRPTNG
jgi:hypothetical protein